jgi:hypothetical protein
MMGPQDIRAQEKYAAHMAQQGMNIGPQAQHSIVRDHGARLGCGIEFQMERLAKNVAAMEERFHALAMKLGPLTRPLPEPAQEPKDTGYSTPTQSPVADQVARLTDQIERLNNGMAYLTDGVDL